jgi:hypothetical protein
MEASDLNFASIDAICLWIVSWAICLNYSDIKCEDWTTGCVYICWESDIYAKQQMPFTATNFCYWRVSSFGRLSGRWSCSRVCESCWGRQNIWWGSDSRLAMDHLMLNLCHVPPWQPQNSCHETFDSIWLWTIWWAWQVSRSITSSVAWPSQDTLCWPRHWILQAASMPSISTRSFL